MKKEGKPGPFIPSEVPAQTGPVRATTPAPALLASSGDQSRRRPGKATLLGRRRVRPGGNACARARTHARRRQRHAPMQRRVPHGRGVFSPTPQTSTLERRRLRLGDNACIRTTTYVCARATTRAPGRQRLRPCDDGCRTGGVFFHQHPKLQRSGDDVCVRATTLAHRRRRPRLRDDVWILFGIFFRFRNPNKTFPLSLFENYSNSIEDGNPKLFLLVGVFLSALNRDLAFLSRHLSV